MEGSRYCSHGKLRQRPYAHMPVCKVPEKCHAEKGEGRAGKMQDRDPVTYKSTNLRPPLSWSAPAGVRRSFLWWEVGHIRDLGRD